MNLVADLLAKLGAQLNPPATEAAVQSLEAKFGCRLPTDLRKFYLAHNGFVSPMDESMWDWWPIERLTSLAEHFGADSSSFVDTASHRFFSRVLVFADALIEAPLYGILLEPADNRHGCVYAFQCGVPKSVAAIDDKSGCQWTAAPDFSAFIPAFEKYYTGALIYTD